MSIYGLSKLMDELIMAKYEALHGIHWTALRYFNVCGAAVSGACLTGKWVGGRRSLAAAAAVGGRRSLPPHSADSLLPDHAPRALLATLCAR